MEKELVFPCETTSEECPADNICIVPILHEMLSGVSDAEWLAECQKKMAEKASETAREMAEWQQKVANAAHEVGE